MGLSQVSHCFALNGNPMAPQVNGVHGIIEEYKKNLQNIQFHGPTHFGDILQAFTEYTMSMQGTNVYQVLIIITDGTIHDMAITRRLIVKMSELPCSVIIVGVGTADFEMMHQLDSDEQLLQDDRGNTAKRDIVQFVEFKEANRLGNLAEEVLKEIPDQVVGAIEQMNYKPQRVEQNVDAIVYQPTNM